MPCIGRASLVFLGPDPVRFQGCSEPPDDPTKKIIRRLFFLFWFSFLGDQLSTRHGSSPTSSAWPTRVDVFLPEVRGNKEDGRFPRAASSLCSPPSCAEFGRDMLDAKSPQVSMFVVGKGISSRCSEDEFGF